MSTFRACSSC